MRYIMSTMIFPYCSADYFFIHVTGHTSSVQSTKGEKKKGKISSPSLDNDAHHLRTMTTTQVATYKKEEEDNHSFIIFILFFLCVLSIQKREMNK